MLCFTFIFIDIDRQMGQGLAEGRTTGYIDLATLRPISHLAEPHPNLTTPQPN